MRLKSNKPKKYCSSLCQAYNGFTEKNVAKAMIPTQSYTQRYLRRKIPQTSNIRLQQHDVQNSSAKNNCSPSLRGLQRRLGSPPSPSLVTSVMKIEVTDVLRTKSC